MGDSMNSFRRWLSPGHWRWWAAIVGLLLGFVDAALLEAMGVRFQANGLDASLWVGAYFGLSFATLGYLLGMLAASRRAERRAAETIRAQLEAINAAQARVAQSEKLAVLGQLAATIAHEVRNPLAIIRSAAQGIAETLPASDREHHQTCAFIIEEIDRLTNVTSSLLNFARPLSLERRPTAVALLLEHAALRARDLLAEKNLRLARAAASDLPALDVDPDLLGQVLLGLLSNAVAASPPDEVIALSADRRGDCVEISVTDKGRGVPAALRERIFEPFFTTRSEGTGLGLAIARQVVEAHGGELAFADGAPRGASFRIRVPLGPRVSLAA